MFPIVQGVHPTQLFRDGSRHERTSSTLSAVSMASELGLPVTEASGDIDDGDLGMFPQMEECKVVRMVERTGHTAAVTKCRFSHHGDYIASASRDGTVRLWTADVDSPSFKESAFHTVFNTGEVLSLSWDVNDDNVVRTSFLLALVCLCVSVCVVCLAYGL